MKSRTATVLGMHIPFLGRSEYFSSTFQTLYHRLTSVSVSAERWTQMPTVSDIQDATTMYSPYYQFGILVFHYRYTNILHEGILYLEFSPNTNVEEVEDI
ncbi:MAG TPA: hypothetical protein VJZ03_02540 [Candidatus Bathyarchaeia archaeon]|nr:hypothetical protein [Candidatus Bathyarchaeia archaeon]